MTIYKNEGIFVDEESKLKKKILYFSLSLYFFWPFSFCSFLWDKKVRVNVMLQCLASSITIFFL